MAITTVFTEPGVYSQFQPTTTLPVLPGGVRVTALIGAGKTTNTIKGEQVTRGVTPDGSDSLAHTATALGATITDEDFVVYNLTTDFVLSSGAVSWSPSAPAVVTGTTTSFTSLVGLTIIVTIDGGSPQTYTFVSGDFAVPATPTIAEIVTAVNSNTTGLTAAPSAGRLELATDSLNNGSILIGAGTANTILGLTGGTFLQTPREPAAGKKYYVDYDYAKVSADYIPRFFFNMQSVEDEHGPVSTTNTVSLGAEIVFQHGASAVCLVQLDPADGAELTQYQKALDKLLQVKGINVVVPLTGDTNLFAYVKNHVNVASSLTERKERIAILGMSGAPSVSTVIAQAQALNDKRVTLVYPTSATRFVGANTSVSTLNGSFLAAAIAGIRTSANFDVAEPLTRKEIIGFDDIPDTLLRSQKNQLSAAGVCVIETVQDIPRVRFGTTTAPSQVSTREISVVEIVDFTATNSRDILEAIFIGQKILADTPSQVRSTLSALLNDLIRKEIIVAFTDLQASINTIDPTQIDVSFKISPVFPLNYILITFSLEV